MKKFFLLWHLKTNKGTFAKVEVFDVNITSNLYPIETLQKHIEEMEKEFREDINVQDVILHRCKITS